MPLFFPCVQEAYHVTEYGWYSTVVMKDLLFCSTNIQGYSK